VEGNRGDRGNKRDKGNRGNRGNKRDKGNRGNKRDKGDKGDKGNKRSKGKRWKSGMMECWNNGKKGVKYGICFLLHYLKLYGTLQ
jgi:hypothetical protein